MPRARPPEKLIPVAYRLTRKQIRKVQEMGGVAWLRELISKAERQKIRTTIEGYRQLSARDKAIVASTAPTAVLAARWKLSIHRVNQIRADLRRAAAAERKAAILSSEEPATVVAERLGITAHYVRAVRRKSCGTK